MTHFKFLFVLTVSFAALFMNACKKGAGEGGRATINGSVFAYNYSNSFILTDSTYIAGYKVYIKYDDEVGISDNTDTDLNGKYSFPYLREGKYTIWALSKQLSNNALDTTVVKTVNITKRNETLEVPRLEVKTLKN